MIRKYPLLLGALRWVGLLSPPEAESAIRGFKEGYDTPCEAVAHYGGAKKLIRDAIKMRWAVKAARKRGHTSDEGWPRPLWTAITYTTRMGGDDWSPPMRVWLKYNTKEGAEAGFWRGWEFVSSLIGGETRILETLVGVGFEQPPQPSIP
jgi:hypothetical protein